MASNDARKSTPNSIIISSLLPFVPELLFLCQGIGRTFRDSLCGLYKCLFKWHKIIVLHAVCRPSWLRYQQVLVLRLIQKYSLQTERNPKQKGTKQTLSRKNAALGVGIETSHQLRSNNLGTMNFPSKCRPFCVSDRGNSYRNKLITKAGWQVCYQLYPNRTRCHLILQSIKYLTWILSFNPQPRESFLLKTWLQRKKSIYLWWIFCFRGMYSEQACKQWSTYRPCRSAVYFTKIWKKKPRDFTFSLRHWQNQHR